MTAVLARPGARPSTPTQWTRARELAHSAPHRLPGRSVRLADAAGLTLARAVQTRGPLPAFDTAAMDGYATVGTGPWQVVGCVRAGSRGRVDLLPGECVEISTGAMVPAAADRVLPVELARRTGSVVEGVPGPVGRHIRRAGEDARAGAVLAPPGRPITPAMLGLAATSGLDELTVRPRPRVLVLVTGDELVPAGPAGGGLVRDALGPMVPSLVEQFGGRLVEVRHVPDHPGGALADQLLDFFEEGSAEVVVVTGSTSVGVTDRLRPSLHALGAEFVVDGVACRPGHPQLLAGMTGGGWLVGLPGNPFAALVAGYTLLEPLLAGFAGGRLRPTVAMPVFGTSGNAGPGCRVVPVGWDGEGARPFGGHRSGFLHGAALADGLAVLPAGWRAGQQAPILSLR